MIKCDPRAIARCPYGRACGDDPYFMDGSSCDKFNQKVLEPSPTNGDRIRAMSDEALERLYALYEAQQDGRLVVLPCKVGDRVKVDARTWGNTWNFVTIEHGAFLVGEIVAIIKTRKQVLMKIRVEHNVSWKRECRRYPVSALGKTVFFTREEAEAALKEAQK